MPREPFVTERELDSPTRSDQFAERRRQRELNREFGRGLER